MKILVLTALILFSCTTVFALPSSLTICWSEKTTDNTADNNSAEGIVDPDTESSLGNNTGSNTDNGFSDKNDPFFMGNHPGHNNNNYNDRPYCGNKHDDDPGTNDNVIPEPTTILLFGLGGLGMGIYRKYRK
jgi:PEP-CTERM motif-containing protein